MPIMNLQTLLPLAIFTLVSTLTPGGATTLATASGAHFGYVRSLPLIAGIAFGLASMAAAAAAGLGGLLLAVPALQLGMKTAGSAYLLWLAYKIARSHGPQSASSAGVPTRLVGGVWMLWHNPKAWAMTIGAAASFGSLAQNPMVMATILALAFLVGASLSLTLWCLAGQILARLLRNDRQWRVLNGVLGGLLVLSIIPMWVE